MARLTCGRLPQAQRGHADHAARRIDERGAPEGGIVRGHDEGAIQHVLPGGRERPHRLDAARGGHEVAVVRHAHRPGGVAGRHRRRIAQGRGRPRAAPLEPGHADPDLEIEPDEPGGHLAPVAERDLDARGVEQDIAHGQEVALVGVEDDAAAPALDAERGRRRPVARDLHADAHHRRLDAADLGGQRGDLAGIEAALGVAGRGRRGQGQGKQGDGGPADRHARHGGYLAVYCAW